ncbi:hypothetical protein [Commensalibacter nepenthis]|uniref:DUF4412 domain-containing protein n=1 Tax=Commensalibacter nepenthis TaxID=3043872 RepID=A0ABT6QAX0_9PROT|nr:hypothetical protein [Commensalibacter sp. TBRC 10068]MDI2113941.1 hypothetical protein [Commensalibacter sp. TBRC 10068]
MTKKKLFIFIGIFIFLIIGGLFGMSQIGRVYMYDSDEEKIDVTSYLKTGQFYFHTDKQYPTLQSLVYKVRPDFMSRDMLLMIMNKDKRFSFIKNSSLFEIKDTFKYKDDKEKVQKIITNIITNNADFSKRMQYQSSDIAAVTGNFINFFIGHFIYNGQKVSIIAQVEYYSASDLEQQKFAWFSLTLDNGFTTFLTPYEQMIEEAKQQPQPKVYSWW